MKTLTYVGVDHDGFLVYTTEAVTMLRSHGRLSHAANVEKIELSKWCAALIDGNWRILPRKEAESLGASRSKTLDIPSKSQ